MGRRAHHHHLILTDAGAGVTRGQRYTFWCGEEDRWTLTTSDDPESRTLCPKCSQAYWGDRLRREPNGLRLGEKLSQPQMAALGHKWTYQHAYPVVREADGEQVGFITLPGGFGQLWRVVAWKGCTVADAEAGRDPPRAMGYELTNDRDHELLYRSKNQALWAAAVLLDTGALRPWSTVVDEGRAFGVRLRAGAAKRAQEAEAKEAETQHIRAAFVELALGDMVTNYQREGLVLAARRLFRDLPDGLDTGPGSNDG